MINHNTARPCLKPYMQCRDTRYYNNNIGSALFSQNRRSNSRVGARSDRSPERSVELSAVKWTTPQLHSADNNITIYYNTREVLSPPSKSNFPFSREPPRNTKATRNYATIQYYNVLHNVNSARQQWARWASKSSTTTVTFLISCPLFNIYNAWGLCSLALPPVQCFPLFTDQSW